MAEKQKTEKKPSYSHRKDAEWLTYEICAEYAKKAEKYQSLSGDDTGPRRELRKELQYRCDIAEVDAINIINGYGARDYVRKYERIRGILEGTLSETSEKQTYEKEYLKWLSDKSDSEANKADDYKFDDN